MKNVLIAIAAFFALTSAASAFEIKGKISDLSPGFANAIVDGIAKSGLDEEQKIRLLAKDVAKCEIDISVTTDKAVEYFTKGGGIMSCPNGLKIEVATYRTPSGIDLKAGTCGEYVDFVHPLYIGWTNGSVVCNFGRFEGALSSDLRMRFTAHAYVPKNLEVASK